MPIYASVQPLGLGSYAPPSSIDYWSDQVSAIPTSHHVHVVNYSGLQVSNTSIGIGSCLHNYFEVRHEVVIRWCQIGWLCRSFIGKMFSNNPIAKCLCQKLSPSCINMADENWRCSFNCPTNHARQSWYVCWFTVIFDRILSARVYIKWYCILWYMIYYFMIWTLTEAQWLIPSI